MGQSWDVHFQPRGTLAAKFLVHGYGYMAVWMFGGMCVCVCECMGAYGCLGCIVACYGRMGAWVYECLSVYECMGAQVYGWLD